MAGAARGGNRTVPTTAAVRTSADLGDVQGAVREDRSMSGRQEQAFDPRPLPGSGIAIGTATSAGVSAHAGAPSRTHLPGKCIGSTRVGWRSRQGEGACRCQAKRGNETHAVLSCCRSRCCSLNVVQDRRRSTHHRHWIRSLAASRRAAIIGNDPSSEPINAARKPR